jgi:hypothetical protein
LDEWEIKRTSVIYAEGARGDELNKYWEIEAVVPIGDQYLCWVDYYSGLVLCDVFDDEPVLRYVALPVDPNQGRPGRYHERPFKHAWTIGTTAGSAVRFVRFDRRCCCGGLLESSCPRSRFSFTVTTWTLDTDSMTWSDDCVLHFDELWALPGYEGLPRVTPEFPVLSMDDDDAVCLMVRTPATDRTIWMIKVDTRSKNLLSVVRYNNKHMNDESGDLFDNIGLICYKIAQQE